MSKTLAAFAATSAVVLLLVISVWLIWRGVLKIGWARAARSARWESHTVLDWEAGRAKVSIRRVSKWGSRTRVLGSKLVESVPVHDLSDPALLAAQAEGIRQADLYNTVGSPQL